MKSSATLVTLATFAALATLAPASTDAAVVVAKDCTQAQRQEVNKLLEQDVNPNKACYAKAKGDITTLSTSRLCPIAECKVWLDYMAENAPDCVYDDTNYGTSFTAKAKDCSSSASGSVASDADAASTPAPATTSKSSKASSSSSGSSTDAGIVTKTKAPLVATSSSSGSSDNEIETIETPILDNSTVTEPTETPTLTTRAPVVTPAPTSASSSQLSSVLGALCAVTLTVAALAF